MSTFSPNLQLEEVARGGDVGTWDTPTNSNWTITDLVTGGIATVPLNNSNIILSAAQFQSKTITFNSTLAGSVTITFPTSFTKSYEIQHLCTGSSAFTITLETTATSGQVICAVPGEIIEVLNDGANIKYKNFGGRIGSYMDWAGSSTPNWSDGCSVPPYLNCNGTTFSSATFPFLAGYLNTTTLPDSRGRFRATLNQGTARITNAVAFDGNTIFTAGGDQNFQSHTHTASVTDPGHVHTGQVQGIQGGGATVGDALIGLNNTAAQNTQTILSNVTGISVSNAATGAGGSGNVPPGYVGGLTLIRAG